MFLFHGLDNEQMEKFVQMGLNRNQQFYYTSTEAAFIADRPRLDLNLDFQKSEMVDEIGADGHFDGGLLLFGEFLLQNYFTSCICIYMIRDE